jgi:hypothetical protein
VNFLLWSTCHHNEHKDRDYSWHGIRGCYCFFYTTIIYDVRNSKSQETRTKRDFLYVRTSTERQKLDKDSIVEFKSAQQAEVVIWSNVESKCFWRKRDDSKSE